MIYAYYSFVLFKSTTECYYSSINAQFSKIYYSMHLLKYYLSSFLFYSQFFLKLLNSSLKKQNCSEDKLPLFMPGLVWIGGACLSETVASLIKLLLQNGFCFFSNCVRKKNCTIESTNIEWKFNLSTFLSWYYIDFKYFYTNIFSSNRCPIIIHYLFLIL